ncbi:DUF6442 family protein [Paenibacillus glycanilyticus]|uniref:DUF2178 domain-containing protein n=1 Tax=Paenibacillus glycanilyticus TaxID=126569 RepID=A0ABQ6GJC4_9BACL|nr:DUF6442 family protein [Paenibacillus glycanilyticus]GLX71009.1 hypothetical protein MU1_53570 [Paenibacillus glycanilyticus]
MNKSIYFLMLASVVLLAGGLYFIKTIEDPQGMLQALPFICFGLGCGMFGHGMGEILTGFAMKHNPAAAKKLEIEKKDERNLAITNRAKAKGYDMMTFMFIPIITALSLMSIDITVLLLLIFVYLFSLGYSSYYRVKYYKEM